jgi:hypothetical protein
MAYSLALEFSSLEILLSAQQHALRQLHFGMTQRSLQMHHVALVKQWLELTLQICQLHTVLLNAVGNF